MEKPGTVAAMAGVPTLVALMWLFAGLPSAVTAPLLSEPAKGPSPPAGSPPSAANDAQSLLAHVLGQGWAECRECPDPRPDVRMLLVTVPDPRDSHLEYEFDRYLESIRRAGEAAEHVLVGFYLPWHEPAAGAAEVPAYRRNPGVLVFRSAKLHALLVVWLVGETPTTGVQRLALRAALDQMGALCDALPPRGAGCDEVRLLGPSFSGSIESLADELSRRATRAPRLRFRLVSGSATAVDVKALLKRLPTGSSFRATVAPDTLTLPRMIGYLGELGVAPERIALLVEGNTDYGQAASRLLEKVRVVPFPSQVGRLREAYEKQGVPGSAERAAAWDTSPRLRRLLLSGRDADTIDVPPVFSQLDSHTTEVGLANVLAALAREHVQYVGLLATDVRDKLFLAQQVRRFCPGSVLFALDTDILFLHPDVTRLLEGALVIAPYPLVSANQTWSYPFEGTRRLVHFPSSTAQGVYNAALALLKREAKLAEYGAPFTEERRTPQLWISVVGGDAFWPLRVIAYDNEAPPHSYVLERTALGDKAPPLPRAGRIASTGWIWALLVLQGLLWALCLTVVAADLDLRWPVAQRLVARAGPLRRAWSHEAREARAVHLMNGLVACLALLVVVAALGTLGHAPAERLLYASGLLLLVTLGCAAREGVPALARAVGRLWHAPDRLPQMDDVASAVSGLIVLAGAVGFAWSVQTADDATQTFVYLRATQLLGGASPLPPLVLLGLSGLLWGACALVRARLLDALPERVLNFDAAFLPGTSRLEAELLAGMRARSPGLVGLLVAGLSAGVPCWLLFVVAGVPGFDGPAFRLLFGFTMFIVAGGTLVNVLTFWRLWMRLGPILRRIAAQPELVEACRKLDPALSWSAMLELGARIALFADLGEAVVHARRACDTAPAGSLPSSLPADVERARASLQRAMEADAAGDEREAVRARLEAQTLLTDIAAPILRAWEQSAGDASAWRAAAGAFAACRVAGLTRHVFAHMRGLLLFSTGSLLLVLLAIASYPIEPRGLFLAFAWTLILGVVGITLLVLGAIERDAVLSALANTTGGKIELNRDFLSRVLLHGGVPVLGLLAAQFPGVFRQIAAWLEPLLRR